MRDRITLAALAALGLAALAAPSRADEESIPLDKLPAAVTKAVTARFPGAELKSAAKETEDGKTLYEVSLVHQGSKYDVAATAEGAITEVEKRIKAADLPRPVSDALKAKYPKAEIEKAEQITKGDATSFEVLIEVGEEDREVVLDASGKILEDQEAEDGEDEDEDGDEDEDDPA